MTSLSKLCELACKQRQRYAKARLYGAVVDVCSAYTQVAQSVETAKAHAIEIQAPHPSLIDAFIVPTVLFLCVIFGDSRAGNVYCVCAESIHRQHNAKYCRSETYIDDGGIIDAEEFIEESRDEYKKCVRTLFGPDSVNDKKDVLFEDCLECIGWRLDFITWTVMPKEKGMCKIMLALFKDIAPQQRRVSIKVLERTLGLLMWYSAVIPCGKSFLLSLYACMHSSENGNSHTHLTELAMSDLDWWRAIVLAGFWDRTTISASIDSLRVNRTPHFYYRSDASTSTGGGAVLSLSEGGVPLNMPGQAAIRWTIDEMLVFESMGVSINVLEYFAATFFIMLWVDTLRGKVISIECDNASAVSWLLKGRARGGGGAADVLVKIFVLFCYEAKIILLCKHLAGVANVVANFRSRDLIFAAQGSDEHYWEPREATPTLQSNLPDRAAHCRRLLHKAVT